MHSYRIHLSPGSRRSSTRSAIARAMNPSSSPSKRNSLSSPEAQLSPPPMSPPALEPARIYTTHSPPPDTPPALEPATLPVAMHIADPVSSRSSSSPETLLAFLGPNLILIVVVRQPTKSSLKVLALLTSTRPPFTPRQTRRVTSRTPMLTEALVITACLT